MALINIAKGEKIHTIGTKVSDMTLILDGSVKVSSKFSERIFGKGSIIGASEEAGENFKFNYEAETDAVILKYPYKNNESLKAVVEANEKIAPMFAISLAESILNSYNVYNELFKKAESKYKKLEEDLYEYPIQCKKLGIQEKNFPELRDIEAPMKEEVLLDWELNYVEALKKNESTLISSYFVVDKSVSIWNIMHFNVLLKQIEEEILYLDKYLSIFSEAESEFLQEKELIGIRLKAEKNESEDLTEDGEIPLIKDAMNTILLYSGIENKYILLTKDLIKKYKALPDKRDTSDEPRKIRRKLTELFFMIYKSCFLKSRKNPMNTPSEVMMFLLFGFFDEEMAGEKNTEAMYRLLKSYKPDPNGHIFTLYQWLSMIYSGMTEPSRNEFEEDYEAYLREQKTRGDIEESEYKKLKTDKENKLNFEIDNLFKLGNRMTFGRISIYQPFFDEENCNSDLQKSFLDATKLNTLIDKMRNIDKSLFRREREFNDEKLDIKNFPINVEVLPKIILLPNSGVRAALWQEIEGKRRDSSARMIMPIFMIEDINKIFVSLCGEFRWEIIKTEQGVHWNDLSDLSLTSEYNDYIQFYRKNRELNTEQKEKIKKKLDKVGKNLRRTFVLDYISYISVERKGTPVMDKVARRIFFTYCPFSNQYRENLKSMPLYVNEINRYETKNNDRIRLISNIIKKFEYRHLEVPKELTEQIEFLKS